MPSFTIKPQRNESVPSVNGVRKRSHLFTHLSQRIILLLLIGTTLVVQRLSTAAAMRFGLHLGRFAHRIAKRPRRKAMRNLRLIYPDWSLQERTVMTRHVFEQFGKSVVDFLRISGLSDTQMCDQITHVEGREYLEAARNSGNGFIIVTGHIGNFELLGQWLALNGVPFSAVARDPVNSALATYTRHIREYRGNTMISKGASARELLVRLGKGEVVFIIVDQNSGDLFLPFLGFPAGTVTGPAKLALHKGVVILPSFCLREPDDSYRMVFLPPLAPNLGADRDSEIERLTLEINRSLEGIVRRVPEQWLWLHNRWKSTFEEKNRTRLPTGYDYESARERWQEE